MLRKANALALETQSHLTAAIISGTALLQEWATGTAILQAAVAQADKYL